MERATENTWLFCCFCGEDKCDLRVYAHTYSGAEDDYICAECFIGRDDGPCWDDLAEPTNV